MPRRKVAARREILADPIYGDVLVAKFINVLMRQGKRSVAEAICYNAFELIQKKAGNDPLKVFKTAMDNIKPSVEVKSRRVGGANYQVPMELRGNRRTSLALRWLTSCAKNRSGRNMEERVAAEIMDASNHTGGSVKKREETHKMAEANRAFAHYRW